MNTEISSAGTERNEPVSTAATMSLADEMAEAIAVLAGPKTHNDGIDSWLCRAARRAGITYRTARALYYGEMPDPRTSVSDAVRRARDAEIARQTAARRREAEHASRSEFRAVRDQLAMVAERLASLDPDGDGETVRALLGPLADGRADRRPVDR